MKLTAVFMKVPEGYAAFGRSCRAENLNEAVLPVLDANRELSREAVRGAEVIREKFVIPAA